MSYDESVVKGLKDDDEVFSQDNWVNKSATHGHRKHTKQQVYTCWMWGIFIR